MLKLGASLRRFWRPVIGVVVAYAVAAQSLLIVLGGFNLAAHAADGAPAFALCLHDGQSSPQAPDGGSTLPGCTHCIFCFAGAHHAVIGAPPALFAHTGVEFVAAPWTIHRGRTLRLAAHAIANPRSPPRTA